MLDPAAVALKFGFLIVLYAFLLWVVRSAVRDLRRGDRPVAWATSEPPPDDATGLYGVVDGNRDGAGAQLVVDQAPGHQSGLAYDIGDGAVLGRGAGAEIRLEDPFASSQHARLVRQGPVIVLEDLGSTNGTYLNDELLQGPQPLHSGDRIRIGDSQFTYEDG